jgi:hypothetical protein
LSVQEVMPLIFEASRALGCNFQLVVNKEQRKKKSTSIDDLVPLL